MKGILLFAMLTTLIVSCGKSNSINPNEVRSQTSQESLPNSSNENGVVVSRLGLPWRQEFSASIMNHLRDPILNELNALLINNADLLTLDCPRFNGLSDKNKTIFWLYFVSAIAIESGYQPGVIFSDREHKFTAGLLLISKAKANEIVSPITGRHYDRRDLLNYDLNIEVGLHILRSQLLSNDQITGGRGRLFTRQTFMWPSLSHRRDLVISAFKLNSGKMSWCR